jgi:glycosyltransferase involved in cell wall biosynthesis
MNILHVIQTLSPRYGGPVTALKALAHEQASAGHRVFICATNDGCHACGPIEEDNITIQIHKASFRPLLISVRLALWLRREISGFDVVHIHGLYRFPVTFAAWYARRKGVPYVISPHGSLDPFLYRQSRYGRAALPVKRIYERLFDMPNLNGAAVIHYTAQEEAQRALPLRLRAKPLVMPIGIDWASYENLPAKNSFRRRLDLNAEIPLVLFLGRINFKKGLDLLVAAFPQVLQKLPQARLAIIGPDNERYAEKVKLWCRELGIGDTVLWVDHLDAEDAKKAFVDADVFVLPSYTENFGMTVVEAMACACPVVISNQIGIWREIEDAGAGMVVELEPEQIAHAICRVLQNKEGARTMGMQGRQTAREHYAWSRIVGSFAAAYQKPIEEAAARRLAGK